ncbi:MAG: hypothetical protein ACFFD8_11085, partial [Candidatus Thorarchaeota archaeon]
MIKINSATVDGGRIWVVAHQLIDRNNWGHDVRPINILAFLGQRIQSGKKNVIFTLGMALENKLASAHKSHRDFVSCATAIGDVSPDPYIRSYIDDQNFMSSLECHLHTLYTCLEVVAEMNRVFTPNMPKGFRKQAKKFPPFSFKDQIWLQSLYDLRSELTHYSSALPLRRQGKLIIEFRSDRQLELHTKGRTEISVEGVMQFFPQLLKFLDEWASGILERLPEDG